MIWYQITYILPNVGRKMFTSMRASSIDAARRQFHDETGSIYLILAIEEEEDASTSKMGG